MSSLTTNQKHRLERLFDMQTGYVLDFTNATFADFVITSIGLDPYSKHEGSKATILRQIWQEESDTDVKKLILDMLERWRTNKLFEDDNPPRGELMMFEKALEEANAMSVDTLPDTDLEFLSEEFTFDISQLRVTLALRDVIEQRMLELEKCMAAEAYLAAIFVCGSTLEGLLAEAASHNVEQFNRASSAPKDRQGKVRALSEWSLENLITTSHELGLVGVDVVKHAHAVKDFRNYIHPRQQIKENFTPRKITAEIAQKVLQAAISDLGTYR